MEEIQNATDSNSPSEQSNGAFADAVNGANDATTDQPKRGPGRPKGSKNKASGDGASVGSSEGGKVVKECITQIVDIVDATACAQIQRLSINKEHGEKLAEDAALKPKEKKALIDCAASVAAKRNLNDKVTPEMVLIGISVAYFGKMAGIYAQLSKERAAAKKSEGEGGAQNGG